MARSRSRKLDVESLEGKQLLSAMHIAHPATPKPLALVLDGTLKDRATNAIFVNGSGHEVEQFKGRVQGMGSVHGTLTLDFIPGTAYQGPYGLTDQLNDATVVLTNPKGSVTLSYGRNAVISVDDLGAQFISQLRFTVQSGTGADARASGAGVYTLDDDARSTDGWDFPHPVYLKLHTTPLH